METNKKYLKKGNRKLPKSTLVFNLPAVTTCPGATKECKKHCYAKKFERMYKNVVLSRQANFALAKSDHFITTITKEIKQHIANARKHKVNAIRIHESGDFFTQEYFDKWVAIASQFPNITFTAYTKVIELNTIKKPKNMILLLSKDNFVMPPHPMMFIKFDGIASVDLGQKLPNRQHYLKCPMDCKKCDYCYRKTDNKPKLVLFPKH